MHVRVPTDDLRQRHGSDELFRCHERFADVDVQVLDSIRRNQIDGADVGRNDVTQAEGARNNREITVW